MRRRTFHFTASYEADRRINILGSEWNIFHFTASYEADQGDHIQGQLYGAFTSQPHTRLTSIFFPSLLMLMFFHFTASYEADLSSYMPSRNGKIFHFTASYEADRNL